MFAIVDIETLKELFPQGWEHCRKSYDGSKAIIHKSTLDRLMEGRPKISTMMLDEPLAEGEEPPYPFPLASGDEINNMPEFKAEDAELEKGIE